MATTPPTLALATTACACPGADATGQAMGVQFVKAEVARIEEAADGAPGVKGRLTSRPRLRFTHSRSEQGALPWSEVPAMENGGGRELQHRHRPWGPRTVLRR